jgi:hypothetical protein
MYYYGTYRYHDGSEGAYCTTERDCCPCSALTVFETEELTGSASLPLNIPRGVSEEEKCEVAALMLEAYCYLHGLHGLPKDRQRAELALGIATSYGQGAQV